MTEEIYSFDVPDVDVASLSFEENEKAIKKYESGRRNKNHPGNPLNNMADMRERRKWTEYGQSLYAHRAELNEVNPLDDLYNKAINEKNQKEDAQQSMRATQAKLVLEESKKLGIEATVEPDLDNVTDGEILLQQIQNAVYKNDRNATSNLLMKLMRDTNQSQGWIEMVNSFLSNWDNISERDRRELVDGRLRVIYQDYQEIKKQKNKIPQGFGG